MKRIATLPRLLIAVPVFFSFIGGALVAQTEEWQKYRELGDKLRDEQRYEEAEEAYAASLKAAERFGLEDTRVAASLNSLALLYYAQHKYKLAETLYQRTIRVLEKSLGPDHAQTAIALENLAELYRVQQKFDEAGPVYERIVTVLGKALDAEDESRRDPLTKLAQVYYHQGRFGEAAKALREALKIAGKHLGEEHPEVAGLMSDLGVVYSAGGKPHEPARPGTCRGFERCEWPEGSVLAAGALTFAHGAVRGRGCEKLPGLAPTVGLVPYPAILRSLADVTVGREACAAGSSTAPQARGTGLLDRF